MSMQHRRNHFGSSIAPADYGHFAHPTHRANTTRLRVTHAQMGTDCRALIVISERFFSDKSYEVIHFVCQIF